MSTRWNRRSVPKTGDYWNRPDVVAFFAAASPPAYLSDIVPPAARAAVAVDIGCGGGRNLPLLAERGYRVIGLDLHEEMVLLSRTVVPITGFCLSSASALPLATGAAAVAVCHGVLHNLTRPELGAEAIGELRRILARGAVASLNLFSSAHVDARLTAVGDHRYRLPNGQVMTLLPPDQIAALCREAGLTIIDGPHEYLREADPGQRSVWRAALEAEGSP